MIVTEVIVLLGYIRSILPFSYVDGPGNRSVIFFQGCNMKCAYCHNPETIPLCSSQTDHVEEVSVEDVIERLTPYFDFISGVTISGGECTIQADFLCALVQALFSKGVDVLIDTNGSRPEVLERLIPHIKGVMLDIKSVTDDESLELTGVLPIKALQSFELLAKQKCLTEVRTVVHESLHSTQVIQWVCSQIRKYSLSCSYKIIAFRPHGVIGDWSTRRIVSDSYLESLRVIATQYGVEVLIIK
jgi:pyruvate formate lyase activating enzyme